VILTDFSQVSAYVLLNIAESSGLQHGNCVKLPEGDPYFDAVVGLAWSHDPESYAGGSVDAGGVSHSG
jgi:hypothetical protein